MRDAVSEKDFHQAVTEAPVPVLLHFARDEAGALASTLDAIARTFDGRLRVGTIIFDDNPLLCRRLGVIGPVLVLFRHGEAVARRPVRDATHTDLTIWLEPLLADVCGCDRCR